MAHQYEIDIAAGDPYGHKRRYHALKLEVFAAYGGASCACCSESEFAFLTLDHKNGGGNAHRRDLGGASGYKSRTIYRWVKSNGFPPGFQVLCWNCNAAKHFLGRCPHQAA